MSRKNTSGGSRQNYKHCSSPNLLGENLCIKFAMHAHVYGLFIMADTTTALSRDQNEVNLWVYYFFFPKRLKIVLNIFRLQPVSHE